MMKIIEKEKVKQNKQVTRNLLQHNSLVVVFLTLLIEYDISDRSISLSITNRQWKTITNQQFLGMLYH